MPDSVNQTRALALNGQHHFNFQDSQLRECYDQSFAAGQGVIEEFRQVSALITAYDLFRLIEGVHSPRVHEAVQHLLLPHLRPVLRRWYRRSGAAIDRAAIELRNYLSQLAGEKLEG
ncbi:MAG: hypothetical protein L0Y58_04330 [Verrucomicrobia subdivision 3 bacterium]|nr:hypothetical protein [Limisphaerales bacterium]